MFESDDFDQVLSQFEFPGVDNAINNLNNVIVEKEIISKEEKKVPENQSNCECNVENKRELNENQSNSITQKNENFMSPKHMKRKIISSHFDYQQKRKFPGPAGLLNGNLNEEKHKDDISKIELLSQDVDFTQNSLRLDIFESPIWRRLQSDLSEWLLKDIDSIGTIKYQALSGNLRRKKAQIVTAFVDTVDRSVIDPLITLRDSTGSIKCTLHRDAWTKFSEYIVSEYCALILQRPTVLTTGSTFKKHYLNITLSNILAIYSSSILTENNVVPDGFTIVYEEDFTVIKTDASPQSLEPHLESSHCSTTDIFDGLDSYFSDDVF